MSVLCRSAASYFLISGVACNDNGDHNTAAAAAHNATIRNAERTIITTIPMTADVMCVV